MTTRPLLDPEILALVNSFPPMALSNQTLPLIGETNNTGRSSAPVLVGDDLHSAPFKHAYTAIRST